jgi:hypothetical protein
MISVFDPDAWDSEGNLHVPLHGIRTAMAVAFLAACAFFWLSHLSDQQWHEHHPGPGAANLVLPLWMTVLRVAAPLVAFLCSVWLLSVRNEHAKAAGAGMVAGLFPTAIFLGVTSLLSVFLMQFYPDPHGWQEALAALIFLASAIWIVVAAFRIGKGSWAPFWLTCAATMLCVSLANRALDATTFKLDRQHELRKAQAAIRLFTPVVDAQRVLASLAGCLILNQSLHPQAGYPVSLDPPPQDWSCETKFVKTAVPEYTVTYLPVTNAGVVTDFQLFAIPLKVIRGHYALMIDSRGILFSNPMWGESTTYVRAATSEARQSEIEDLKRNIDTYMKEKALGAAPEMLTPEVIGTSFGSEVPHIEEDGRSLSIRNYAFHYVRSRAGAGQQFALSAHCQSYGENCLRSYFLDRDGVLHATGEPRDATAQDALALDCEASDSPCRDVLWPSSARISGE